MDVEDGVDVDPVDVGMKEKVFSRIWTIHAFLDREWDPKTKIPNPFFFI
jgi:hypothetical protein